MPATAPVNEIGYTQNVNYNWWLYDNETTPELIWPQSVYVYDQMRRTDSQVASVLRAVTLPVRRTPWRIDPAGARARVVKFVADDLGLPIVGKTPTVAPRLKDRFSWPEHLRQALLMLVFGHYYFEQVYRVDGDGAAAHLRKLAPRPPKTIERIDIAADGGLVAIKQYWTSGDAVPKPIPVNRLVAYVHDREGGNWLGSSLLRPAYKHWLIKDRLLRVQAQTIERNGMGIPLYKGQDGASSEDLAAGKNMATAWRAGEAAGSAVPFGADLVLRGVEGTLPDADPAIRYHDEQIARAVLAHFLNLGTQTGSWALGTTFADFFTLSLQTLAQQIADTVTSHVIEDLVDVNFGEDEPAPRLIFDEIGSRQAATAEALKALVDAGIVHPDQVLEETSRQQYGLPPADPATATAPPQPATPATPTPEPPTPAGALSVAARFDPAEPREPHSGKWVGTGGTTRDVLKLANRIDLKPGETFAGSDTIHAEEGRVNLAWIKRGGETHLRFGAGGGVFQEEAHKWRAADRGHTVELDAEQQQLLRAELTRMTDRAKQAGADMRELNKEYDRFYAKHGDHPSGAAVSAKWLASLPPDAAAQYEDLGNRSLPYTDEPVAHSAVYGSWGAVRYEVQMHDLQNPRDWSLIIGVRAKGAPDSWDLRDGSHGTWLSAGQVKKLQGMLAQHGGVQAAAGIDAHPGGEQLKHDPSIVEMLDFIQAAAGHDVTPGHDELHHYWTRGEGLAKWVDSPKPWTTLVAHLTKYVGPEKAKVYASRWFIEVFGYASGSDKNRVAHGHPPRGHVVGPG